MERLFVYGTLQDPVVQERVCGRVVAGMPDALAGFTLSSITLGDGVFRIIVPGGTERIPGLALDVTADELARMDVYEGDDYRRIRVTLESGADAWVYSQ